MNVALYSVCRNGTVCRLVAFLALFFLMTEGRQCGGGESAAANSAAAAPAPVLLKLVTDALPAYVFGDDELALSVGLQQKYGQNQPRKMKITVESMPAQKVILPETEIEIPKFEDGTYQLRVPVVLADCAHLTSLSLRVKCDGKDEVYPLLTVCDPLSGQAPAKDLTVCGQQFFSGSTPAVFRLPHYDETAVRRWQPVHECARMKNWFAEKRLLVAAQNYGNGTLEKNLRDQFAAAGCPQPLWLSGDDLLAMFLQAQASKEAVSASAYDTVLTFLGVAELAMGHPAEVFLARAEALIALMQSNYPQRRIYVAGPPPFPAKPELRELYVRNLRALCERRHCRYIDFSEPDEFFITSAASEESQTRYAGAIVREISFGPGLIVIFIIPFLFLSLAFWWLRSFSRYSPKIK